MTKKDLFEYLDAITFVDASEVNLAVADFFAENFGLLNPSFGELMEMGKLADEYINTRKLTF